MFPEFLLDDRSVSSQIDSFWFQYLLKVKVLSPLTERDNKALCSLIHLCFVYFWVHFNRLIASLWNSSEILIKQNKIIPVWTAAIVTWYISSRQLSPPRTSKPHMAPRRCSHGRCGLWDTLDLVGLSRGCQFSRCCSYPFYRSAGYWQRCPSHQWSSRRHLRSHVWSLTQTWGPWRIFSGPQRSIPENSKLNKYM